MSVIAYKVALALACFTKSPEVKAERNNVLCTRSTFFPFRYSVFRKFNGLEELNHKIIIINKGWNLKLNLKRSCSQDMVGLF